MAYSRTILHTCDLWSTETDTHLLSLPTWSTAMRPHLCPYLHSPGTSSSSSSRLRTRQLTRSRCWDTRNCIITRTTCKLRDCLQGIGLRVWDAGCLPIPHIPVRHIPSRCPLERIRVGCLRDSSGSGLALFLFVDVTHTLRM
jgi:hypothetical protein